MSEMRWDPLKKTWVLIANERERGPDDFPRERQRITLAACPFCYGQEAKTPAEIFAVRRNGSGANSPGWQVRVIPNKYPVLRSEGAQGKRSTGLHEAMNGIGAHEVIIETPDHERAMSDFTPAEIIDVLTAFRIRLLDLRQDPRFRYILIYQNHGVEAGAPIPHAHSQLLALPTTPPLAVAELSACREFYQRTERCLFCDILRQECEEEQRIVSNGTDFVVLAPYASKSPFELQIAPKRHEHDFARISDREMQELAETLRDTLRRMRVVLHDPPYNLVLHTSPPVHLRQGKPDYWSSLPYDYHWHIELVPLLTEQAGFERGTGLYMNSTPPETAARCLRAADLSLTP